MYDIAVVRAVRDMIRNCINEHQRMLSAELSTIIVMIKRTWLHLDHLKGDFTSFSVVRDMRRELYFRTAADMGC